MKWSQHKQHDTACWYDVSFTTCPTEPSDPHRDNMAMRQTYSPRKRCQPHNVLVTSIHEISQLLNFQEHDRLVYLRVLENMLMTCVVTKAYFLSECVYFS